MKQQYSIRTLLRITEYSLHSYPVDTGNTKSWLFYLSRSWMSWHVRSECFWAVCRFSCSFREYEGKPILQSSIPSASRIEARGRLALLERVQTAFLCPDNQCFWTFGVVGANFAIKIARTRTPNFDAACWISGFWYASNPSVFQWFIGLHHWHVQQLARDANHVNTSKMLKRRTQIHSLDEVRHYYLIWLLSFTSWCYQDDANEASCEV